MAWKPIQILINAKDEASSVFDKLKDKVVAVGVAVAGYFGIQAFAGMVKGAADFEQAMSRVQAATGASAQEMAALRKAAEDAGANTKFTASQAAESLENLAKAGLNSAEAIETLPAVMALAQAAGIGLGESAEFITKAVMGMGLQFADAGRVADVLAKGANASNTSVTGLAQALSYTAPIAKSLGVSLESTVAIIGKLADGGIDASRAGTGLASIMAQFSDPSSKFKQALLGAGITTKDFEAALRQLAAAGPRAESAILAVGLEAGPALRSLLNQGMGALDELTEKLRNSSGAAAEAARVMNDNLNGSLTGLSSAWDTVKNALLTPVLPVLKDGVDKLAASLRGAVSDGTIAQFGAALKAAFESGIKWVQEFVASFDWETIKTSVTTFAAEFGQTMTKVGEYARTTSATVQIAWNAISTGASVVMGVIYKIAEAFAGVASNIKSGVAIIMDGLSKITFGGMAERYRQAAEEIRISAAATWAVSEEFAKRAEQSFDAASRSAEDLRDGFGKLADGIREVGSQSASTESALQKLIQAEVDAGAAAFEAAQKKEEAAEKSRKAQEANAAADAKAAQALKDLRDKLVLLRQEYDALLKAGDVQGAVEKLKEVQRATEELARAQQSMGQQGSKAAEEFSAGLTRMGVNADAAMGRVSGATRLAIDEIESLEKNAKAAGLGVQQTARAMEMAFAAAIPKADTLESVEALKTKLKQLGDSGQVSADGMARLQQALEKQKGTIEDNIPGIQSLGEALRALGVKPQAELKAMADKAKEAFEVVRNSGTAAPREINQAWKAMAEAAIAANDGIADSTVTAEAAAHGYKVAVDDAGKATIKSMEGAKDAAEKAGDAGKQAGEDTAAGAAKATQSVDQLAAAFFTAENAASKYAGKVNELMWQQAGYGSMSEQNFAQMSAAANRAVRALEDIDRAQAQLEASGSSAANGLADLELRLLQLSGTEEDVARGRARREAEELARKTELLALDLRRLEMLARNNARDPAGASKAKDDLEKARAEMDYLTRQQQMLQRVHFAEAAERAKQAGEQRREEDARAAESAKKEREQNAETHREKMAQIADETAARKAQLNVGESAEDVARRAQQQAQRAQAQADKERRIADAQALDERQAAEAQALKDRQDAEQQAMEERNNAMQRGIAERQAAEEAARREQAGAGLQAMEEAMRRRRAAEDEVMKERNAAEDKAAKDRYDAENKVLDDAEQRRQAHAAAAAEALAARRQADDERAARVDAARKAREAQERAAADAAAQQQEQQRQAREAARQDKPGNRDQAELTAQERQRDAVLAAQKKQADEQARLDAERAEAAAAARAKRLADERAAEDKTVAAREKSAQEAHQRRLRELEEAEQRRQERVQLEREYYAASLASSRAQEEAMLKTLRDVAAAMAAVAQSTQPATGAEAGGDRAAGSPGTGGDGGGAGAASARTVNLVLSLGGGERETIATDDSGAAAIERFLRGLETAKRNTGR